MQIRQVSVDSLIIYFGNSIEIEISKEVKNFYKTIKKELEKGIIDTIPSYSSILITFDIFVYEFEYLKNILENLQVLEDDFEEEKIINIDVYYALEVGFDLQKISNEKKVSIEEIIHIHTNKIYDVYAVGFLPAFAYMGSVDEKIATSRLLTPRKSVPKGSVAIADTQTAVYPVSSPAGWNILGKTALNLFDKNLPKLGVLEVGNRVKFNAISKKEFLNQGGVI